MPKLNVSKSDASRIEIHYQTHGNPNAANKVILISGLGAICSQWDYQVEYLSKLEDFQICVFDNRHLVLFSNFRGAGFSDAPGGKYTTTMLADDALALIDYLKWDSVNVVGLSMGGMIAQELAFKLQNRVASLALLSTYSKFNGLPAFENFKLSEPLKILGIIKQLATAPPPRNTPEEFAAHTASINFPEDWLDAFSKEPGKAYLTNRQVVIEV
jgi:pimeloyl-ACP methyl ester carboxylesterase